MRVTARTLYGVFAVSMAAVVGCSRLTTIGISGEADGRDALATSSAPRDFVPREPSAILSAKDEIFDWASPFMGDIDGDGIDDFILPTLSTAGQHRNYLFYGRKDLPDVIATADADATFAGGPVRAHALGDVNGDDLADFAVTYETGFELVLGSRARWSGTHQQYSLGPSWHFGRQQADGSSSFVSSVRRIGDVDGDGFDELVVTVVESPLEDPTPNGYPDRTDYLIAGRADGWPSGDWDPSWAIAQFEGAYAWATPLQLEVIGSGDLDGDGYVDIFATAGNRPCTWVFYGSASGLTGALTSRDSDAEITWAPSTDGRYAELEPNVAVLGDLDGDGTTELGAMRGSELSIRYGSAAPLSGAVELTPDLLLDTPADQIIQTRAADIDGDGLTELIVHTQHFEYAEPEPFTGPTAALYLVRTTSMHAEGRYELSDSDLYRPAGTSTSHVLERGFTLDVGGDVDGDGSYDLMILTGIQSVTPDPVSVVYLMPGMPRAPD